VMVELVKDVEGRLLVADSKVSLSAEVLREAGYVLVGKTRNVRGEGFLVVKPLLSWEDRVVALEQYLLFQLEQIEVLKAEYVAAASDKDKQAVLAKALFDVASVEGSGLLDRLKQSVSKVLSKF